MARAVTNGGFSSIGSCRDVLPDGMLTASYTPLLGEALYI